MPICQCVPTCQWHACELVSACVRACFPSQDHRRRSERRRDVARYDLRGCDRSRSRRKASGTRRAGRQTDIGRLTNRPAGRAEVVSEKRRAAGGRGKKKEKQRRHACMQSGRHPPDAHLDSFERLSALSLAVTAQAQLNLGVYVHEFPPPPHLIRLAEELCTTGFWNSSRRTWISGPNLLPLGTCHRLPALPGTVQDVEAATALTGRALPAARGTVKPIATEALSRAAVDNKHITIDQARLPPSLLLYFSIPSPLSSFPPSRSYCISWSSLCFLGPIPPPPPQTRPRLIRSSLTQRCPLSSLFPSSFFTNGILSLPFFLFPRAPLAFPLLLQCISAFLASIGLPPCPSFPFSPPLPPSPLPPSLYPSPTAWGRESE
eukprot:2652797-Pleurochrysis_carterae.AAC.1